MNAPRAGGANPAASSPVPTAVGDPPRSTSAALLWRASTTLFVAASIAFALISIAVVLAQAIYVPYWDQWDWLRRYFAPDGSRWRMAIGFHNGHFMAVTSLVYAADIALFGASNLFNVAVTLASLTGVAVLLRGAAPGFTRGVSMTTANVYFGVALVLLLWFFNWENLFWPFQVHAALVVLFAVAGLRFMTLAVEHAPMRPASHLVLAVVMGLLAASSSGGGLAFWPAAMGMIALGAWPRRWKIGAIASIALLMLGQAALMLHFGIRQGGAIDLSGLVTFVVEFLGSPAFFGGNFRVLSADARSLVWTMGMGYLGVAIAVVAAIAMLRVRRRRLLDRGEIFVGGLAVFALTGGGFAALARAAGDLPAAGLSSRYGLLCLLYWLAVPGLLLLVRVPSRAALQRIETVVPLVLLLVVARSQVNYLRWWLESRNLVEWAASSLVSSVSDPEQLGQIFPRTRTDTVLEVTATLLDHRTSALYEERTALIGHAVAGMGPVGAPCASGTARRKVLQGGVRLDGSIVDAAPFGVRRVLVADDSGVVVGIGAVERRLPLPGRRELKWVAYAPTAGVSAPWRVYIARSDGLCTIDVPAG